MGNHRIFYPKPLTKHVAGDWSVSIYALFKGVEPSRSYADRKERRDRSQNRKYVLPEGGKNRCVNP